METYLQTAWGDQWDNVSTDTVKMAIEGLKKMDDEHGVFWVGLIKKGEENIFQVNKKLGLIAVFEDNPEIEYKGQGKDWNEIESLFEIFLADKMDTIRARLRKAE
ncbi:MAG TPA: hypothetical protein VFU05_09695 [Cyclobacteriaceae bacterium]|nr:hypothetical protein [Cyclobacteriaceae bacterium]